MKLITVNLKHVDKPQVIIEMGPRIAVKFKALNYSFGKKKTY